MFDLHAGLLAFAAILGVVVAAWLISIPKQDVSIVDSIWSLLLLVATGAYLYVAGRDVVPRAWVALALVGVWALRLMVYITVRNHGAGEDRRYQAIRARHQPGFAFKSLYLVFILQGVLAWILSLSVMAAVLGTRPLSWLDALGVLLWVSGFVFEAVGDAQLARFKAGSHSKDQVMDRGLWHYTRHPNYFGECCMWWGLFLLALASGGWWSIVSPLMMTVMLLKVSGVALLEKDLAARRPAYRDYIARTSAFLPWPPRSAGEAAHPQRGTR